MKTVFRTLILSILCALCICALFACKGKDDPTPDVEGGHDHVYSVWEITKEPTTNSIGECLRRCVCGETDRLYLPALGEEGYETRVVAPTCTEEGETVYVCAYGSFSVPTPALGHEMQEDEASSVAPTCAKKGKRVFVCSRCGEREEETLDEIEHAYRQTGHRDGSCKSDGEKGSTTYVCDVCGDELIVPYKKPHVYDEGEHTDVVCPEKGYTTYACRVCGEEKIVYDERAAHVYDEHGVCSRCGDRCAHVFDGYDCEICGLNVVTRMKQDGYFHVDADGNGAIDVGETIYLGFYPSSVVSATEEELLASLDEAEEADGVVEIDGERYARVSVDQVRGGYNVFSDGSVIASHSEAYFRFEPVSWTVVSTEDGVTLWSDRILDVTDFLAADRFSYVAAKGDYMTLDGETYADDWSGSDVRAFLNGAFLQTLLGGVETDVTAETFVDNESTNYYATKKHAHGERTSDVAFLPAFTDLYDEDEAYDAPSDKRRKLSTDYAKARGLSLKEYRQNGETSPYYLRSVGLTSRYIAYVDGAGVFHGDGLLYNEIENGKTQKGVGLAPMIHLNLSGTSE